jgi:hypothetical protein
VIPDPEPMEPYLIVVLDSDPAPYYLSKIQRKLSKKLPNGHKNVWVGSDSGRIRN